MSSREWSQRKGKGKGKGKGRADDTSAWSNWEWDEGGWWYKNRTGPSGQLEYQYEYPPAPQTTSRSDGGEYCISQLRWEITDFLKLNLQLPNEPMRAKPIQARLMKQLKPCLPLPLSLLRQPAIMSSMKLRNNLLLVVLDTPIVPAALP